MFGIPSASARISPWRLLLTMRSQRAAVAIISSGSPAGSSGTAPRRRRGGANVGGVEFDRVGEHPAGPAHEPRVSAGDQLRYGADGEQLSLLSFDPLQPDPADATD